MKSDELSLILSETEINSVGLAESKGIGNPIQEIHREENFGITDTTSDIQKIYEKENKADLELKELHINSFDDNVSDISKVCECVDTENTNNYLIAANTLKEKQKVQEQEKAKEKEMQKLKEKEREKEKQKQTEKEKQREKEQEKEKEKEKEIIRNKKLSNEKSVHTAPPTQQELPSFTKIHKEVNTLNTQILETKPKVNQKVVSTTKAKVLKPLPKTLKSKSMSYSLPSSSFKHDGYTLAYIENKQRKAAAEIIRNKRRPSSSGV